MTGQKALLRLYHSRLREARNQGALMLAHHEFHAEERHREWPPTESWLAARDAIYHAHAERIAGRGSPADCDAALNEALRSIAV